MAASKQRRNASRFQKFDKKISLHRIRIVIFSLLFLISLYSIPNIQSITLNPSFPDIPQCDYVFVDGGSNRGDNVDAFMGELSNENFSGEIRQTMANILNRYDRGEFCVFGFEGNPQFSNQLKQKEKKYLHSLKYIHIFTDTILSYFDGESDFFIAPSKNSVASGAYHMQYFDWTNWASHVWKKTKVQTVDLHGFLERFDNARVVILKLDIEGSEYETMSKVVASNVLCKPEKAFLSIEWHRFNTQIPEKWRSSRVQLMNGIKEILEDHCNVTMVSFL